MAAGDKLTKLTRAIGIHFIDFDFFADARFLRQYVFKDKETNEEHAQLGAIRIYFLEMNKARKDWSEVKTNLDRWLAVLNEAENLDPATLPEALSSDPVIVRAVAKLERMGFDANEREVYETEVKARMMDLEERELLREEMREEVRKEVLREGMQQGIERGKIQGLQAGKESLVMRQMSRRIGDVPDDLAEMLDRLSADELDEFGEALLDFNSFVDVRAWLSSH